MQAALAHWPPGDLHQLTTLVHRMVDDFLTYAAEHERGEPGSWAQITHRRDRRLRGAVNLS